MRITIQFFSYLKTLTGCAETTETLPDGSTLGCLHEQIMVKFPKLAPLRKSILLAVGLDYQPRDHVLKAGDEVSLFPPVQGG